MSLDHLRACTRTMLPFALQHAYRYHAGDVRKDGSPYLSHLLAVAAEVADDPAAMIAALLHDIVEHHGDEFTLADVEHFYGPDMAAIVDALTHRPNEPRVDYIGRVVAAGPIAKRVKLADLIHNFTNLDDDAVSDADYFRLSAKYQAEIARLAPLVAADQARRPTLRVADR